MKTVCAKDMCAGCMACINMCKKSAITIVDDYKTYNAVIDEVKCVNCGLCEKICPNVKCVEQVNPIFWKEGWALNPEIRSNASSGGIASSIIYSFIKNGGYVASCMLNKGEFVFELTNSTQRAEQFVGSKYVKSNPKTIYIDIERKLQEGKKVLFVGLPCQVAALKNFSRNQDNLYTVDLICHGSPSPELLKMYLKEKSVDIEELEGLNFREKTSFGLRSVGKNNGFPRIVDMYTYAFLKSIDYTENCYSCRYASQSRVSDISLGDSWGSELSEEEKKKGISLVLCQTKKGEELLKKSNVELFDADITRAIQLNHQLEYPSRIPSSRMFFFENLEKGFDFAILSVTESASAQERIAESANYILHNWMPTRTRLCHDDHLIGCSAEGHVSHVLSDRMSSRPLGWCRDGANQMAHLRAYYFNKGNMLELVKAQKFPKAAGAEDTFIIDPHKLGETMYSEWGKYVDHANHEVSEIAQKFAWFNAGITLI